MDYKATLIGALRTAIRQAAKQQTMIARTGGSPSKILDARMDDYKAALEVLACTDRAVLEAALGKEAK